MSDLDNGFHPKRTHGRTAEISRIGTRPHHRDGSPAYMPSDDYMRGFGDGNEAGREEAGGLLSLLIGAAFGFIGGAGMVAGWLVIFQ